LSQKIIDKLAWREDMAISKKKAEQKQNNKKKLFAFFNHYIAPNEQSIELGIVNPCILFIN